jgi:hypothetical protein
LEKILKKRPDVKARCGPLSRQPQNIVVGGSNAP